MSNGRDSYQLFVWVFDTCLLWYLLVLPSETQPVANKTSLRPTLATNNVNPSHFMARWSILCTHDGFIPNDERLKSFLLDTVPLHHLSSLRYSNKRIESKQTWGKASYKTNFKCRKVLSLLKWSSFPQYSSTLYPYPVSAVHTTIPSYAEPKRRIMLECTLAHSSMWHWFSFHPHRLRLSAHPLE